VSTLQSVISFSHLFNVTDLTAAPGSQLRRWQPGQRINAASFIVAPAHRPYGPAGSASLSLYPFLNDREAPPVVTSCCQNTDRAAIGDTDPGCVLLTGITEFSVHPALDLRSVWDNRQCSPDYPGTTIGYLISSLNR